MSIIPRKYRSVIFPVVVVVCAFLCGFLGLFESEIQLDSIILPEGFSISLVTGAVPNARQMVYGDGGTLFVSTRRAGNVYAVIDTDGDYVADRVITLLSGMNTPNGIAFRNGSLYVAEINRVLRYDNIETHLNAPPEPVVVNDTFPDEKWHGWKYIRFGPDGKLYVPVGAPCNVCKRKDPRFSSIMRMKPDGSGLEVFAHGIRNTVGFDWHPATQELWFTENGRDWMGDDQPPDELNCAPRPGLHFGFPFIHGMDIRDPAFTDHPIPENFTKPVQLLGPHVAALGMRFYTGSMFPEEYKNQVFIAEHGSWNRSTPIGYRISLVRFAQDGSSSYHTFAQGWLHNGKDWGRPVDLIIAPDGSLLVSDDKAGAVYRIFYRAQN